MVVKEGYKQTEVGVIPNEWEVKKIGEVCQLINGRGFKPFEWKTDGLPIIRIQNLNGSQDYNYYQGLYDKKLEVDNGQLLFAWSGSRGTSFGPHIWNGSKGLLNYHTWKIIINENEIAKTFFTFALKKLTKYIEDNAHGASALVHTQKWEMEGFEFPAPSNKIEQTAIATALSDADALIASLEKLITKKRNIKQGAMQQLLQPKEGWEVKKLGEVCHFQNGTGLEIYFNKKDGYKVISIGNYSEKGIFNETYNFIAKYNYPFVKKFILNKGELAFLMNDKTAVGTIIGRVLYIEENDKYVFNQRTMRLSPNIEFIDSKFLFHLINSEHYHSLFVQLAKPGTQIYLNTNDVLDFEIIIPNSEEQTRIATILSDMDAELSALEQKLEKYKKIKLGMMQELLTGKTRLL